MTKSKASQTLIVSDIGGTHVRFGLSDEQHNIDNVQKYKRKEFKSFHDVLSAFETSCPKAKGLNIALAIAGSRINSETWGFAREQWAFQQDERISVYCNDLEALAFGAANHCEHITLRDTQPKDDPSFAKTVISIGTGLGYAYIRGTEIQKTHGGHMRAFGITMEQNTILRIIERLSGNDTPLIFEDIVCGPALIQLYQAVCIYNGFPVLLTNIEDIIEKASDQVLNQTLRLFHEFFGLFSHMCLMFGHGFQSLYLGGGVLDQLVSRGLFDQESFTSYLNQAAHPKVRENLENCPIHLISDPDLTLKGAAIMDNLQARTI